MVQSMLVEANLHLAVWLLPNSIVRVILYKSLNFKKKIKVEIELKFYCTRHNCSTFCALICVTYVSSQEHHKTHSCSNFVNKVIANVIKKFD